MQFWVLIFIAIITYPLCRINFTVKERNIGCKINNKNYGRKIYIMLNGILSIIICGFRHISIGNDTEMYLYKYNKVNMFSDFWMAIKSETTEVGYSILEYLIGRNFSFDFFKTIVAIIAIAPVMYVIYKYSKIPWVSILVFISFGTLPFYMSGMRQSLAMGITTLSFVFIMERKRTKFILCIIIATIFHSTAIIFLPAYWFQNVIISKKNIIISFIFMILSFVLKDKIFTIFSMFSRQQYNYSEAGGEKMYIFIILSILLGIIYNGVSCKDNKCNETLLYMMVAVAIIWPIASVNPALFRIYYYYSIFMILFIPNLIYRIKDKIIKLSIYSGYLVVAIYFLVTQVILANNNLNPYMFFWK